MVFLAPKQLIEIFFFHFYFFILRLAENKELTYTLLYNYKMTLFCYNYIIIVFYVLKIQ